MEICFFRYGNINVNRVRRIDRGRRSNVVIEFLAEFIARPVRCKFSGLQEGLASRMRHDGCAGKNLGMMDASGMISLLEPGLEVAQRMYERHKLLSQLLVSLGVDPDTAREDACKIEHDLSVESFAAIRRYASEKL